MGRKSLIDILVIVFAVLDVLILLFGAIYLTTASKKITSIQLTPDFTETEIGVNSEYTFTVSATPAKASLKKVDLVCSDPSATFKMGKDGKATLTTGAAEGSITVSIKYKKVESNSLTFQVVDLAARAQAEAEAAAAAAAAEAAEAEAAAAEAEAAAVKMYVKMTGDNVNIRSQNNTDCDILGKAKKGDMYEKVETIDDWTHIMYNGQDGYIKTEYLADISEEEYNGGASSESVSESTSNNNTQEQATEEKKEETAEEKAAKEAAAAEEAAKKAEEEAQKALQEAAAAQAAAAAAGPVPVWSYGGCRFSAAEVQIFKNNWGDAWTEMAPHHPAGELKTLCRNSGVPESQMCP